MKKTKTLILTMAAYFAICVFALAADDVSTSITVKQTGEKQALIRIANLSEVSNAVLKIKDEDGHTLYREVISEHAHMQRYDFSGMPDGTYEVQVKTAEGTSTEVFEISAGKNSPVYFKPAIQVEQQVVKVAFMNKIDTPLTLKLYAEDGKVLYEENVASQAVYAKGLNLSQLEAGQYSVSLVGDNYTYSRSVDIR